MRTTSLAIALICCAASPVFAQSENAVRTELRTEAEHIREACESAGLRGIGACAVTLATEHPLHIAFGSLAPHSGVGIGTAWVGHHTPNRNWRITWNGDAVISPGGSWRTGAYTKFVRTAVRLPTVVSGDSPSSNSTNDHGEYPVYGVHVQSASLDRLRFFGLGPQSAESDEAAWNLRQTMVGGTVVLPIRSGNLGVALLGGISGRFIRVRDSAVEGLPSIGQRYTEISAPGLTGHARFAQFGGGVRLRPTWLGGYLLPEYLVTVDRFATGSSANATFSRWTVDLTHAFSLYRTGRPGSGHTNGPDDCAESVTSADCPPVSRNRDGRLAVRALMIVSATSEGHAVPFYLQPTLGGSDINGAMFLASFPDYRFRAPDLLAFQAAFDHSLPFWEPLRFILSATQGKTALQHAQINLRHLAHSYATGLTVRAGGFPQVALVYSWGHGGQQRFVATVNASVLGGSARPSLY